ncbi:RNA polymerase sigma factor [Bacillus infantis]|uniref:RNA polymerase sigma factor n=1 Tax=Bacillus infantis TaxID=324767 RepID=A0A5D4R8K3_9BACI|nr:RNA polymerase sigma factor [Bacillus infantis]TYS45942.1 RNA polymerase sigma factor [Bacillus infantis]
MDRPKAEEIEDWYESYSSLLFKYLFLMTNNSQTAEDLTQETFLKAFQKYESFKRDSSPKTWLFKLAYHTAIDYLRRRKALTMIKGFLLASPQDTGPTPEEVLLVKERSIELFTSITALKETYRSVIILRKIQGFSIEETSEILGWSVSKVKSTTYRALQALEKELIKGGWNYAEVMGREEY